MLISNFRLINCLTLGLTITFLCTLSRAEGQSTQPPGAGTKLIQILAAQCPAMLSTQFLGMPDMKPILEVRHIDSTKVCSCANSMFKKDLRLFDQLSTSEADLAQRIKLPLFRSYLIVRFTHSLFSCLLPEIEKTLSASDPSKMTAVAPYK